MKFFDKPLEKSEIDTLIKDCGQYVKVTADLEKEWLVVGCELHADGEKILLNKGSNQDNIWGGGINLQTKEIDTTAVLNLRPNLNNTSLEILNPNIRKQLIRLIKKFFKNL